LDKIEFEDDAPIELTEDTVFDSVSEKNSTKLVAELEAETDKEKRRERMKKNPPPLKLTRKAKSPRKFKASDYIVIHCNLCEIDIQHAKKDDEGNFMPFALCQHVIFKGAVIEE